MANRPRHAARNSGKNRRRKKLKRRRRHLRVYAKRVKRSLRNQKTAREAWQMRLWWDQRPLELSTLLKGLAEGYPDFTMGRIGRALVFRGEVDLDTLERTRRLIVIFPGPPSRVRPIVMADGPTRSRHRFTWARPTSLCLYYAADEEGLKWNLKDGLVSLIDLSRLHLIKEAWWRVTGEWEGWELHRRSPTGTEQKPRPPKDSSRRLATYKLRRARARCWCGTRRYVKCHGAISARRELEILGIATQHAEPAPKPAGTGEVVGFPHS